MIIPSIDIMGRQAVQLVGGETLKIEAGDPVSVAEQFKLVGDIAVIDLDAAMGTGSNQALIKEILYIADCRVGGGIRTEEKAFELLNAGAKSIIIGTKAEPKFLEPLPKERLMVSLDAKDGEVVVEGWQKGTGTTIPAKISELKNYVSGFLVTFVEREGRMQGTDLEKLKELVELADPVKITVAGGVTTVEELTAIEKLGADAQVGMALYSGKLKLGEAFAASVLRESFSAVTVSAEDSVIDVSTISKKELADVIDTGRLSGYSVSSVGLTAAADAVVIYLDEIPSQSNFPERYGLKSLERIVTSRKDSAPEGSYTKRLYEEPGLLEAKIKEEAGEFCDASTKQEIIWEAADLLFFSITKLAASGVTISEVEKHLAKRALQTIRRGGDKKSL